MISKRHPLIIAIIAFVISFNMCFANSNSKPDSVLYAASNFNHIFYKYTQFNPDSSKQYFENGKKYFIAEYDTMHFIYCAIAISRIEQHKGYFNIAFDKLWEVMNIAEAFAKKAPLIEIYRELSDLYQIIGRGNIALSYELEAKRLIEKHPYKDGLFVSYLSIAVNYIEMDSIHTAVQYLDSCYSTSPTEPQIFFADGIYGITCYRLGKYQEANAYLHGILPYLLRTGNAFQVDVLYNLGNIKFAENKLDSAIKYYNMAVNSIDSLTFKIKLKPEILKKCAQAYFKKGNSRLAFLTLHESSLASDSLFSIRSDQYQRLFEINNAYKQDLKIKKGVITQQEELLALGNKSRLRLRLLLGIIILAFIIGAIALRLRYLVKQMSFQQKLNRKKNEEIIEIKNKELTGNALKIIEKEQAVKDLLKVVKEKVPESYAYLNQKYTNDNKKIWNEFHLRFSQINSEFYKRLTDMFPALTQTDLRHCALIKLKFNSKEMSHFLGISVGSVHVARSRIRKKLKLKAEDDLGEFLSRIIS